MSAPANLDDLALAAKAGDERALAELLGAFPAEALVARKHASDPNPDQLHSTARLAVWRCLESWAPDRPFMPYAWAAADRACRAQSRIDSSVVGIGRLAFHAGELPASVSIHDDPEEGQAGEQLADPAAETDDDILDRVDSERELGALLAQLPLEDQELLRLHFLKDYSLGQIAGIQGLRGRQQVHYRLQRALASLRAGAGVQDSSSAAA